MNENNLFCDYYEQWVAVYKEGAVRPVTLDKYKMTLSWVKRLAPDLKLCEVSRVTYQQLLNDYAVGHERQTTMDFHHQLKGAIMDAVDDGLIVKDPTRKVDEEQASLMLPCTCHRSLFRLPHRVLQPLLPL